MTRSHLCWKLVPYRVCLVTFSSRNFSYCFFDIKVAGVIFFHNYYCHNYRGPDPGIFNLGL